MSVKTFYFLVTSIVEVQSLNFYEQKYTKKFL